MVMTDKTRKELETEIRRFESVGLRKRRTLVEIPFGLLKRIHEQVGKPPRTTCDGECNCPDCYAVQVSE